MDHHDPFALLDLSVQKHDPGLVRLHAKIQRERHPDRRELIDQAEELLADPDRQACYRAERFLRRARSQADGWDDLELSRAAGLVGEMLGPTVDLTAVHSGGTSDDFPGGKEAEDTQARRRFYSAQSDEVANRRREGTDPTPRGRVMAALAAVLAVIATLLLHVVTPDPRAASRERTLTVPFELWGGWWDVAAVSAVLLVSGAAAAWLVLPAMLKARTTVVRALVPAAVTLAGLTLGWLVIGFHLFGGLLIVACTWVAAAVAVVPSERRQRAHDQAVGLSREDPYVYLTEEELRALWDEVLGDWALTRAQYSYRGGAGGGGAG